MRATLIGASGRTVELGDIVEGDFVLVDAEGQQLARGTVAGPHAFQRQVDGSLVLHGTNLAPTFIAREVGASNRRLDSTGDNAHTITVRDVRGPSWPDLQRVVAPPPPRFGWPDPNRGGARKRRRGRR